MGFSMEGEFYGAVNFVSNHRSFDQAVTVPKLGASSAKMLSNVYIHHYIF